MPRRRAAGNRVRSPIPAYGLAVPASTGDDWLTVLEAAKALGITNRTLYTLIDNGSLPAYKIGRVIRLRRHEVDAFIEAARVKPGELAHLLPFGIYERQKGRRDVSAMSAQLQPTAADSTPRDPTGRTDKPS